MPQPLIVAPRRLFDPDPNCAFDDEVQDDGSNDAQPEAEQKTHSDLLRSVQSFRSGQANTGDPRLSLTICGQDHT